MNILYLYSELGPYNIPVIKTLVEKHEAHVYIISWDKAKLKPYTAPHLDGVTYYKRSEFSASDIVDLCVKIRPDIVYVSGWMDKGYFPALKFLMSL